MRNAARAPHRTPVVIPALAAATAILLLIAGVSAAGTFFETQEVIDLAKMIGTAIVALIVIGLLVIATSTGMRAP